jgi:hypothetical protein
MEEGKCHSRWSRGVTDGPRLTYPTTEREAVAQLDDVAREVGELRGMLEALRAQEALAEAMLAQLRDRVDEVERTNDEDAKPEIIELLVASITVMTTGEGAERRAIRRVTYVFGEPRNVGVVENNTVQM